VKIRQQEHAMGAWGTKRRSVLKGVIGALLTRPDLLLAQTGRVVRVALLAVSNESSAAPNVKAFLAGMRERGYVEQKNMIFDSRYADGDPTRLRALADELLALKPDVVIGTEHAIVAMRSRTSTVPLVLLSSVDPVAAGLATSLARPGGNVTGLADLAESAFQKQFQLLTECLPGLRRVALVNEPQLSYARLYSTSAQKAAEALGLVLVEFPVKDRQSLLQALVDLKKPQADALVVIPSGLTYMLRGEIAEHALQLRVPSLFSLAGYADAGGLLSYGANFPETFRYAAAFVDRILKGAKPAEMPIEQLTKLELVVNLKTARALGVNIPQSILLRADRVIE
jgi:putative ABC transport system substrate-binding protein